MHKNTNRLFFIDAIRAWAILMMLQGHFVDGLLDNVFRDNSNTAYTIWKYFRGITAPVFFTVSGFIFSYLLVKVPEKGWANPRVQKGIKRGIQLIIIGYLLRLNLGGLLKGQIYPGFYLVDVLHCIGLSLLIILSVYLLTYRSKHLLFPLVLVAGTILLFTLEPVYKLYSYSFFPKALANYFTKANGSVFTVIPWVGYTLFGGFMAMLFSKFKDLKYLYHYAISICILGGVSLIFFSSGWFSYLHQLTDVTVFKSVVSNNYLYIRLGDVLIVFAVFMLLRSVLQNKTLLKIGQSTLSIYVVHFIILYGSFTGLGLYRFFHHSLTPEVVIPSAIAFMIVCTTIALFYEKHKEEITSFLSIKKLLPQKNQK